MIALKTVEGNVIIRRQSYETNNGQTNKSLWGHTAP
jgi:hypothetical protein